MITRTIDKLLVIVIALHLSGCCNVPASSHTSHSVVSWDGLGVSGNPTKRQLQRIAAVKPKKDPAAELSANNLSANDSLLLADESDAPIGERVSFEKLDRTLTICRGC